MLIFLYFVFLCSNFLLIKSEATGNVNINLVMSGHPCTLADSYIFREGQNITLVVTTIHHINHGWWELLTGPDPRNLSREFGNSPPGSNLHTAIIEKSMQGIWQFKFLMLEDNPDYLPNDQSVERIVINQKSYVVSNCRTNVTIEPPLPVPAAKKSSAGDNTIIIACTVGAILVAIIVAQAAYIMFLKAKAQKLITLNTHNNLSKKSDAAQDDTARYCSNPGQKMMKASVEDDNRDSVIYEAPNIEIPGNPCMSLQPPQPPAINTMPRTPRADQNRRIMGPQSMLASALNSPARSPISENLPPNFQRPNHNDREHSVANRPRLPPPVTLHDTPDTIPKHNPNDHMFQEVYEEMESMEENTYEPPPVINTLPPRLAMPPKKVPTGNLLDTKENTLKLRQGNKPPVTPKPARPRSNIMAQANEFEQPRRRNETMPKPNLTPAQQDVLQARRRPNGAAQINELEEALRRRNNAVMQVPIQSIPDSSSRASPKPKPPPSKPWGQSIPHPVQEEIYYNENQASSDEEWTYEPLKPLNTMQVPIVSIPDPVWRQTPKPRPLPSKPRGAPIPHPVQEEIYYNENQVSSDEEWIYEPLKPLNSYTKNM